MKSQIYIPESLKDAGAQLRAALAFPLERLPKTNFVRAWSSIAYLFPGLHPDGYDDPESGWPRVLARFAAEAWRRAGEGELSDNELYTSDAQWCGIYDRLTIRMPDEIQRRIKLAADNRGQNS